ncbi:MAG: preprotein translocase subunit SecE [Planctomycetes bacterium]|nr:preprotein translocase subunit SecE [Planctomycetota bacterium]
MGLKYYKKEQGKVIRIVTAICLFLMVCYGYYSLYRFVPPINTANGNYTFWGTILTKIPFFDFGINYGMIISALLCLGTCFFVYLVVLNKPKTAEFLIESEAELKKVSWPSRQQYTGSSVAVIISVVVLGLFLVSADWIFLQLMKLIRIY